MVKDVVFLVAKGVLLVVVALTLMVVGDTGGVDSGDGCNDLVVVVWSAARWERC